MINRSPRHVNINWTAGRLKIEHDIERMKHEITIPLNESIRTFSLWTLFSNCNFLRPLAVFHCSSCFRGEFPHVNESTVLFSVYGWIFILRAFRWYTVGHLVDDHARGRVQVWKIHHRIFLHRRANTGYGVYNRNNINQQNIYCWLPSIRFRLFDAQKT